MRYLSKGTSYVVDFIKYFIAAFQVCFSPSGFFSFYTILDHQRNLADAK